jgi:type I restriction enzyme M protein
VTGGGRVAPVVFNRYFYVYQPPRPLEEIEAEIREIEGEIIEGLRALTGRVAG